MVQAQIKFRPYIDVAEGYDTGLATVGVDSTGQLVESSTFSTTVAWGVSGSHSWRYDALSLDYRGSFSHYPRETFYDGISQSMLLAYSHQFSRRVTLAVRETAGIFTRSFGVGGLQQTVPYDPASSFIPVTDFFDNRTFYMTTQADLIVQRTPRLSFMMGGDYFVNRRRSDALHGVTAKGARNDVQYRLSRRTTVGANYAYYHYNFTGIAGTTDIHSSAGTWSSALTRRTELAASLGFVRLETKFVETQAIDPAIAALFGITSSSQTFHTVSYQPTVEGRLSYSFRNGVLYIAGGRKVVPGNGLFLTSFSTNALAGYGYTGLRRWSFRAQLAYSEALSYGNIRGHYSTLSASCGMSRTLFHSFHLLASYSARQYDSADYSAYHRFVQEARIGIGYSPGDIPLRIW